MNYKTINWNMRFMDAFYSDNKLWFVNEDTKELVNVCLETGNISVEPILEEFENTYRRMLRKDNNLYLVSNNGCAVCCGSFNEKVILNDIYVYHEYGGIRIKEAFLINNQIWCVTCLTSQSIIVFDLSEKKFFVKDSLLEIERRNFLDAVDEDIMTVIHVNNNIYYTKNSGYALYQYDYYRETITEWKLPEKYIVSGFDGNGQTFFMRRKHGIELYKWDKTKGILNTYKLPDIREDEMQERNAKVRVFKNESVILIPTFSDTIAYLDTNENCLKRIGNFGEFCHCKGLENSTFSIGNLLWNNQMLLFPWAQKELIRISLDTMEAKKVELLISEADAANLKWERRKRSTVYLESESFTLQDELQYIKSINLSKG